MRVMAKFALPQSNWQNILEHTLLVAIGAGLTYITENVGNLDFGQYTPLVVAVASILASYIKKVIDNPVGPDPFVPAPPPPPAPRPDDGDNGIDFPVR